MKGPSLVVDNSSFVEIASAMIFSLQTQLPYWPVSHLVQQGLVMMEIARACPARSDVIWHVYLYSYKSFLGNKFSSGGQAWPVSHMKQVPI